MKHRIVATLRYGRVFNPIFCIVLIVALVISVFFIPLIIYFAFLEKEYILLCVLILNILIIPIAVYSINYFFKVNKQIKLWKKDAICVKAKCKQIGSNIIYFGRGGLIKKAINISISFAYQGKKIVIKSSEYEKKDLFHDGTGCDVVFKKYRDRSIKILYSPTFNQVMILND